MSFKSHGIEHLSPSSLNLWTASPGIWGLRYLSKVKEPTGASAARGNAVEQALKHILYRQEKPLDVALAAFDEIMQGEISPEIDAERALIPGMVKQCELWLSPSEIAATQQKVEVWLDGVSVPLIGYLDFSFMCKRIVDLKTTKACPSKPKPDHIRQVALYSKARENAPVSLLYVTDKRHAYFPIDTGAVESGLNELHAAAISLQRFLSLSTDPELLVRCLPIDTDNFRFSEAHKTKLEELHL